MNTMGYGRHLSKIIFGMLVVVAAVLLVYASYLLIIALVIAMSISQPSYPYVTAGIPLILSGTIMTGLAWSLGRLKGIQEWRLMRWPLLLVAIGFVFVVMDEFLISHLSRIYWVR